MRSICLIQMVLAERGNRPGLLEEHGERDQLFGISRVLYKTAGYFNSTMLNDQTIVTALRNGDDRAFIALYHRYKEQIYRFCLKMTGDVDTAKDIVQSVLSKYLSGIRRLSTETG